MNALTVAEELPIPALFVQGVAESREPSQRDEHAAAVGEFEGQVVVVARYIDRAGSTFGLDGLMPCLRDLISVLEHEVLDALKP